MQARSNVELDDALAFLDQGGRANLRASLLALGRGLGSSSADTELNGTLAQLATTTDRLGALLAELRSQRGALTGIVSGGRTVLGVLAAHAGELRALTADADTALSAVGDQRSALGAALGQLPRLEALGSRTLRAARPLISTATPLVAQISSAAPALTRALDAVPASTSALDQVLAQASSIRSSVLPALWLLRALATPGSTATTLLGPALADIVPMAQYLGPRGRTIAAWFANTADLGSHGDAKGDWARFFVMFDPSTLLGRGAGAAPGNSYTPPGDAAHNNAFAAGGYPRLEPYSPALTPGR
jgi:hypothetical protein